MKRSELTNIIRTLSAILLIALEFTNIIAFFTEGGNQRAIPQHSRYPVQFAAYGLAAAVLLLDRGGLRRFLRKPIVHWSFCLLILITWSMVVRTFNTPPIGYGGNYDFVRSFGLRVNAIGFLLTCVIIFDDREVLRLTKKAIAIATLVGVAFNVYDFLYPGIFSTIPGRAAGLYMDPNCSGMALVFGALLGLSTMRRLWMREMFLLCVLVGVLATFSREAMFSFVVLLISAAAARAVFFPRLVIAGAACLVLFAVLNLSSAIMDTGLLTADTFSRVTLRWSDSSEKDRLHLAEEAFEQFEEAPLLGQGFGTAIYWADDQSHNAYLGFLADCGILGALVIPGLIFSLRRTDWEFYAFASIFLLWSFFYHDVLTDFYGLIVIAVEANQYVRGYRSPQTRYALRMWGNDEAYAYRGYPSVSFRMMQQKSDAQKGSVTA